MAQEPFIQPTQTETSVRQAFEDYIQSRKKQKEAEGQKWEAESKYRTSLKLIEDSGIVLDNMSLKELNTEENIERIMTNERLLKGEKTVRGDRTFGTGTVRALGNHLNTIFNNLRAGEANALASWNAKNKGRVNPFDDGTDKIPFSTLGFDLTDRKPSGQIKTAPDKIMLKAFRDTLDDIQDIEVGRGKNKKIIPAKIVKAHMLMTVITGMRSPDINNFVSQINPSEEQLKATDSVKTFLRSDDYSMVINNKGKHSVDYYHKKLGKIMWDKCGMSRNEQGLKEAIEEIAQLREEFWKDVYVPGEANEYNEELAKAGRVADFLELGELFAKDALHREESCGGHFREEYQTEDGEAKRRKEFQYVSAWEYKGEPKDAVLHKEELVYDNIEVKERSYK